MMLCHSPREWEGAKKYDSRQISDGAYDNHFFKFLNPSMGLFINYVMLILIILTTPPFVTVL